MKNIMEMTWKEIDEVNKAKGILCITVAPIEEHGLHLPLGTDIYEGEHWIKLLAEKMESEFHDIHAGFVETSSMLYIKEELVKGIYKELPNTVIYERQMGDGKKIIEAMGEYGHLGAPKYADKAIGKELNENFAEYLVDAVRAFIERKDFEQYEHHFLHDRLLGMTV